MEQILFEQVEDLKTKQFLSQEEIEQLEAQRKEEKLKKMEASEFGKYFIVRAINEVFQQSNVTGIENLLNEWIEKGSDPETIKLKEIFDKQGAVVMLKYLNNQWLKEIDGCSIPGFKNRIKETRKHKEYLVKLKIQSKKAIEKELKIDDQILKFVNKQNKEE